MDKQTIENLAKKIALDLNGPLGPIPLERVIIKHLGFIEELKTSGATWPQIALLLDKAGAKRKNGKTISADQLRSVFSRNIKQKAKNEVLQSEKKPIQENLPSKNPTNSQAIQEKQHANYLSKLREKMQTAYKARNT